MKRRSRGAWMRLWRKSALLSAMLFLSVAWITLDSLFAFTASDEGRVVVVPDFCGMQAEDLELPEWVHTETEYRYDEKMPAGVVFSQIPAAGSVRKLSEAFPFCELRLVVSLGREQHLLPETVGTDVREAVALLRGMGMSVQTERIHGPSPIGEVLRMQPQAGTKLPKGSQVLLFVSAGEAGEAVQVPALCGMTRSDALIRLWLAGLSVKEIVEEHASAAAGTVIRQSHLAGTVVPRGTKITLCIAAEKSNQA